MVSGFEIAYEFFDADTADGVEEVKADAPTALGVRPRRSIHPQRVTTLTGHPRRRKRMRIHSGHMHQVKSKTRKNKKKRMAAAVFLGFAFI